jgi:uncharacterized protein YkwD
MLPTKNPASSRSRIAAALLALAPFVATLMVPVPTFASAPVGLRADEAAQQYTSDAKRAINVARAKKNHVKVKNQACMTRYAQGVAEKDAAADHLSDVDLTRVYRRCDLHYVVGVNARDAESGKAMINQVYLKSSVGRDILMRTTHRITGLGAAQAEDGTWYFMVVMSDRQL